MIIFYRKRIELKYQKENFDDKCGQQLFKPKITRGPLSKEDQEFREKIDICTRMYYFFYVKKEIINGNDEREVQRLKELASKSLMSD